MNDILVELSEAAKTRVAESKARVPLEEMMAEAAARGSDMSFPFEAALKADGMSFICEVKKASPSKGVIAEDFDPVAIAREYEAAGADCISVLTEPTRFLGDIQYLRDIHAEVATPILRKDFVVDEYMIYEAKAAGASAVLLIVSILSEERLREYLRLCDEIGLSALVEIHDDRELKAALESGARIIGVNNRNLRDFSVDPSNCLRLRHSVPEGILFVAESGIKDRDDVRALEDEGVDAVLIGESLMRAEDKAEKLQSLRCGR
jgi:indole-3-glycerol phosphate synthase